nr:MAG TPA: hypothetical protein [Caudoviricetes sp.]
MKHICDGCSVQILHSIGSFFMKFSKSLVN